MFKIPTDKLLVSISILSKISVKVEAPNCNWSLDDKLIIALLAKISLVKTKGLDICKKLTDKLVAEIFLDLKYEPAPRLDICLTDIL